MIGGLLPFGAVFVELFFILNFFFSLFFNTYNTVSNLAIKYTEKRVVKIPVAKVKEKPLIGFIKYSDGTFKENELVGYLSNAEYEFVIDNKRLYRVKNDSITIKYECQGHEKEYNPSWT